MTLPFDDLSLIWLAAIFAASATAVWFAGWRLAGLVDGIANKTGVGQAFMGMLLLGGITSLPEVAAVSTSAAIGNAPLAVNNLLGTASINILLLALADVVYGRGALTVVAARPATLMQGVLSMLLATVVALVATVGDVAIFGVGVGSTVLAIAAVWAVWLSSGFERRHTWEAVGAVDEEDQKPEARGLRGLIFGTVACAILILAAGFLLSSTADVIATKTGMAAGLVGFVLVGFATSLPEVSSITAAVRLKRYQLAIGDVFGTNIFNIMLIFLADLLFRGDAVLARAGRFEVVGAVLAILMTGIFIVGLLERKDKAVLRMGYDSLAAIIAFGMGLWLLSRATG